VIAAEGRPLPRPSELTRPFWEAAARRELVRPLCRACGRSFFTPQAVCTHCLAKDWSYEPSAGRGEVYSATVVHRPPHPGMRAPFHLAIVDLDEGWSMLANLATDAAQAVPIGTRVTVDWLELDEGFVLPVFVP
jgi:uncharacterized OB-fold protein